MGTSKIIAPYGTWESPISATLVARSGMGVSALPSEIRTDGTYIYWIVTQPQEGGRYVILRYSEDTGTEIITPKDFNVRTRVHEYGGGDYFVNEGIVYFSNYVDQRLYRHQEGASPQPITPKPEKPVGLRYAAVRLSPDKKWLVCVRERHEPDGHVVNELVILPEDGAAEPTIIASSHDFYGYPRFSPDGKKLAFLIWDHPNMPWDGTELWVGDFSDGKLEDIYKVAGGTNESIFQPEWNQQGDLHFVSDRSGWWNLYAFLDGKIVHLYKHQAEFGFPQWVLELSMYAFLPDGRIACLFRETGESGIGLLSNTGEFTKVKTPFSLFLPSIQSDASGNIWFLAGSYTNPPGLAMLDPKTGKSDTIHISAEHGIAPGFISKPQHIAFPSEGGRTSYTYFYPPANASFEAPADEKPPLIVLSHGGPTSAARPHFQSEIQFWTSRGFAVADVNYGGSTGYGRPYRDLLKGEWGIVDVEDCVNAALFLAKGGKVDGERLLIRGGSAGGYVTLCALTFHEVFAAGASYYGVADAAILAQHTHKFEERYLDSLIGPYPEKEGLYRERSPIHHTDRLSSPVILLQGLEDEVVHPEQSEILAKALHEKGLPYVYLTFEGEQHGFRRSETIQNSLEAELYFYSRILGFELPAGISPIEIHNLE
ncbi:MAG: prolyl oligopeptidase family serine peptidase [Anaerolineales bacterium]|jgi:dipeptidyl aminopeptidase/acylaminoacyl peptidase